MLFLLAKSDILFEFPDTLFSFPQIVYLRLIETKPPSSFPFDNIYYYLKGGFVLKKSMQRDSFWFDSFTPEIFLEVKHGLKSSTVGEILR